MGEGGYRQINKTLNVCAFEDYLSSQQASLPTIADVEQISPRVIRVLGQNPGKFTLQGTNTYIVGTGSRRAIIDTAQGYREWADLVAETLDNLDISLSHVFLSHWHGDHTGGVADLVRMYPHLADSVYKNSPDEGQNNIEDGEVFTVEGATIRAVHSPGHSHDHMCFIIEEDDAMFTGDNVLGHGTSAVEELSLYMDTLSNMRSYGCAIGYPAHGVVIQNLSQKITGDLAQKMRREKMVLQTLSTHGGETGMFKAGPSMTVKELVTTMHGDTVGEGVRENVLEPFTDEVLRKLAEEGKVAFEMSRGDKRWFGIDVA